jgi:hypothetical protein
MYCAAVGKDKDNLLCLLRIQVRFSCVSDMSPLEVTTLDLSDGTVGPKKWMFPVCVPSCLSQLWRYKKDAQ